MPFWNLGLFDRYYTQMKALSDRTSEFHVVYRTGAVREQWLDNFIFTRVRFPRYGYYLDWITGLKPVWRQIRDIDVDLYYCLSGHWFQYYAHHFSKKAGKPFVIRWRGDDRETMRLLVNWRVKKWLREWIFRRTCREADLIIPITEKIKEVPLYYGADESKISEAVYNGVDLNYFKYSPRPPDAEFRVGYVGRLNWDKGLGFLDRLMRSTEDIRYVVAGDNQVGYEVPENCEYLGYLPHRQVGRVYENVDVVVVPSLTEGLTSVLLESYASGRPVVGTDTVFLHDDWVYGWRLPLNLELWTDLLRKIRGERSLLNSLGSKARKFVEQFTWDRFGDRMINCFEEALR